MFNLFLIYYYQQISLCDHELNLYRTGFAHPAVEYVTAASVEQGKEG